MLTSTFSENRRDRSTVNTLWSFQLTWIGTLGLILLCLSTLAQAQAQQFDPPESGDAPWSTLSTAPYLPDPTFNQGLYLIDQFAGTSSENFIGKKIVRLSNGTVVVAGLVPSVTGAGRTAINLGLVQYNSAGQRVAWTNPGTNGFFANNYVIYPNSGDPANSQNVKDVLDMKVVGNRVLILIDRNYSGGADIDSKILAFGTDGAYLNTTTVFGTSKYEYSGGIAIRSSLAFPETLTVAVVASTFDGAWRPSFRSGTLNADSSITFDPVVYPNPGNYCPTGRGCILRDIAAGGRNASGASTKFYLAGARQSDIPDTGKWDFLTMAVNFDGSPVTSFGGAGVTTVPFFEGGNYYNDANSIQVETTGLSGNIHDEIYISGFVDRECKDGFGVAKLKENSSLDTTFGKINGANRTGKLVLGGAIPPFLGSCSDLPPLSTSKTYANDSILENGKLALAGYTSKPRVAFCIIGQPCQEEDEDAMIAVVDTLHGDVDSFRTYPYSYTAEVPRTDHSGFWGITPSSNGGFTATGDIRRFQNGVGQPAGPKSFATLRVISDGIFANGFDSL